MGLIIPKTVEEYRDLLLRLTPTGFAWPGIVGVSGLGAVFQGVGDELARISARVVDMLNESDPRSAFETLEEWEESMGIPNECESVPATVPERRELIQSRLIALGGMSIQWYIDFAATLGYEIEITEEPPFAWTVHISPNAVHYFLMGQSPLGEPLRSWDLQALWCGFDRLKPAHTSYTAAYDLGVGMPLTFDGGGTDRAIVGISGALPVRLLDLTTVYARATVSGSVPVDLLDTSTIQVALEL